MITKITLKNYRCFSDEAPAVFELRPGFTSFIGINNAGKSTLLRFLYEFRKVFEELAKQDLLNALNARSVGNQYRIGMLFPSPIADATAIYHDGNNRPLEVELELTDAEPRPNNEQPPHYTLKLRTEQIDSPSFSIELRQNHILVEHQNLMEKDWPLLTAWLNSLASTLYIGPFRNIINAGANTPHFDLDTGDAFVAKWQRWKTVGSRRENAIVGRLTADIRDLFGFTSLEINAVPDNSTLQLLINGHSYRLGDVGSGLAQFIMVLINAAVREPDYILIDEPELHLHPALQQKFLATLDSYSKQGILFATHTIGLARSMSNRIYSLHRPTQTYSTIERYESHPNLDQILGELSFAGLQENGYDKILLVERPTEIRVFIHFLRLYQKDHRIVPVSLGGGNLIHANSMLELSEITRLNNNIVAIIDSERTVEGEDLSETRQGFLDTCDKLNITHKVLDRRAIENYLSARAIQLFKNDPAQQALTPYELLNGRWKKPNNWRIAWEMNADELDGTDLGQFLASL